MTHNMENNIESENEVNDWAQLIRDVCRLSKDNKILIKFLGVATDVLYCLAKKEISIEDSKNKRFQAYANLMTHPDLGAQK